MSLRLRMALWYAGLTGVVVLLVTLASYALHSRAHYDDLDQILVTAGQHVTFEGGTIADSETLRAVLAAPLSPEVALRVYDRNGRLEAASPNAGLVPDLDPRSVVERGNQTPFDPLLALAPPLHPVTESPGTFGVVDDGQGERWRIYVLPEPAILRYLVVAAPLARVDTAVDRFRQTIPLFALLGAVVTWTAGWLLAGRVLQPVAAMTETARRIAHSGDTKQRVAVPPQDDEVGQLAETFNEMLASVDAAAQTQQRFVSDASHELRAPLTAIKGNLDLLRNQPRLSAEDRREALEEASREAERLIGLVADLLALARADAGVPLRRERVELDRVLLEALSDARHLAREQTLEVAELEPAEVEGDRDRLQQLLVILLDNALKYTPGSGTVTIGLRREGACAVATVADNGVGIGPDALPHVFERFYRADPARSRDPGGTGLGLPIAQWIARQHGGDVALESTAGEGTSVRVTLPLRASRARALPGADES